MRRAAAAAGPCPGAEPGAAGAGVGAQSVTATQLQALAERAVGDPRALAQLRAVREVDGRPVDIGRALAGAEGPALASRLRTLAAGGPRCGAPVVAADAARRDAEDGARRVAGSSRRGCPGRSQGILSHARPVAEAGGAIRSGACGAGSPTALAAQLVLVVVVFVVAAAISLRLVGRRSPPGAGPVPTARRRRRGPRPRRAWNGRRRRPSRPATSTGRCGCGSSPGSCASTGPAPSPTGRR